MVLNYRKCAEKIYDALGQRGNLIHVEHCATRLRVSIKEMSKVHQKELEETEGVQGVIEREGQLQIVIGTGAVNRVYHEFRKLARISELTGRREERRKDLVGMTSRVIRVVGDVFIPILPAVVASGLLMGILEALEKFVPGYAASDLYQWMYMIASTGITYLPVLVAISAARLFGGNLYLGGTIGLLLMHRDLLTSWSAATMPDLVKSWHILGLSVRQVNYQGHVIPVIIAVWLMCRIEKWLHRRVPEMLDLFITPPLTVLVTAFLTMGLVGPFFILMEDWILNVTRFTLRLPLGVGAFLCGGAYPLTVIFGTHHMFGVLENGMLAENGKNIWITVSSSANFAMCMSCLAVFVKARSKKIRSVALPASLSAALGITEPAIFGINLRFFRPLVCGMIGAAFGAAAGAMMGVYATTYGVTGILGFLITMDCSRQYLLMLLIAGGISFLLTVLCWDEPAAGGMDHTICAPVSGKIVLQEEMEDETFASGLVGKGVGIVPVSKTIVSPFDGTVIMTAQSGHAVALKDLEGVKVLLHVGRNATELDGKGFQLHVTEGEHVKKGQKLITVDLKFLKEQGYDTMVALFVTNSKEIETVTITEKEEIKGGEVLIKIG